MIYVNKLGLHVASYHFSRHGYSYIDNSEAPADWGGAPPIQPFYNVKFDFDNRTFSGEIDLTKQKWESGGSYATD